MQSFVHQVLGWKVHKLKETPCLHTSKDPKVPTTFKSEYEYRDFLLDGVMEESWGITHNAFLQNVMNEWTPVQARYCTELTDSDGENGFILCSANFKVHNMRNFQNVIPNTVIDVECHDWCGLGLLYVNQLGGNEGELIVKMLLPEIIFQNFTMIPTWQVRNLRISLTPKLRMHQSLSEEISVLFLPHLINGTGGTAVEKIWMQSSSASSSTKKKVTTHPALASLNRSQKDAMSNFFNGQESDLQILHGPPGTGKTTAITALLQAFVTKGSRVLVTSPSNKAIRVVATKFLKETFKSKDSQCPPIVMLSAADKISSGDEHLSSIFVDTWSEYRKEKSLSLSHRLTVISHAVSHTQDKNTYITNQATIKELDEIREGFNILKKEIVRLAPVWGKTLITQLKNVVDNIRQAQSAFPTKSKKAPSRNNSIVRDPIELFCTSISSALHEVDEMKWGESANVQLTNELCNHAQMVFSTLSILGRQHLRRSMRGFDSLIIDEGAQCTESEMCIAFFYKPKKCLMVGDVNQLPATVISKEAQTKGYGRSAMERLMKTNYNHMTLKEQYRMHPEIFKFPNKRFYHEEVDDADNVRGNGRDKHYHRLKALGPYSLIDVPGSEEVKAGSSFTNQVEANVIANICSCLQEKFNVNLKKEVAVVTFYKAQVEVLRQAFSELSVDVPVNTVDSFQGCESNIVILSTVRAHSTVGFVSDFRRLNVALTRARNSCIVIGHLATLASAKDTEVSMMVEDAYSRKMAHEWTAVQAAMSNYSEEAFNETSKNGGNSNISNGNDEDDDLCDDWEELASD